MLVVVGGRRLPLRGREEELGAVEGWLESVRTGGGGVIVIEAQAGLGKSRLIEEAASMAEAMSFRTGRGVADPALSLVGLSALLEALFEGADPLIARGEIKSLHSSPEQQFWLLQDIETLLERAALERPLLICLDDMHWGGSGCATALRTLPQWLSSLPVAWIFALRPNQCPEQVTCAFQDLMSSGADRIRLRPLDSKFVAQIVADILGSEADENLLEAAEQARGNPFLLVELLLGLQEEGLISLEDGRATLLEERIPARLSESMKGRLAKLSPAAQTAAKVASSLGRRFSVNDVAALSNLSLSELVPSTEELIRADIWAENGDHLSFGHDLIRGAIRASVSAPVIKALDRSAADVLLAGGALPLEVASQIADSADRGDEVAIVTLLKAADASSTTDPAASADLAQRALELAPLKHPLRGPLVSRRTVSLFAAGRGYEAKDFVDSALREALPAEEEAQVRLSIAGMFVLSPDIRAENARKGLALPDLPADLRAWLLASLFFNLVVSVRTDEALELLPIVREAFANSTSVGARYAYETAESAMEYQLCNFERSLNLLDDAERHRLTSSEDARERLAQQLRCVILAALDRSDEALRVADEGIAAAQRDRQNWGLHLFETWKARHIFEMGRLDEAVAILEGRFSVAKATLVVGVLDGASVFVLGRARIHLGDERGAQEIADISKVMLETSSPGVRAQAAHYLALHAWALGDRLASHEWLCAMRENERSSILPCFPQQIADDPEIVRIAIAADDVSMATDAVDAATRRQQLNPGIKSLEAVLAHARGILLHSRPELLAAVDLFEEGPRPLAYASALEDLGSVQIDDGDTKGGVEALDRALLVTVEGGATWDAARIRRRLRAVGIRRRITSSVRPATGWESLTNAEVKIAELVAEGNTNRDVARKLFVSPHTVNTHIRHVFEKLNVKSRVELANLVRSRGE